MQQTTPIASFLAALVHDRTGPTTIPRELTRAARRILRGGDAAEVDDLVGDFLLRLVEATRRGTSASAKLLLPLHEKKLRGVVRHRMQHVLAERSPQRQLVKQLRDAVRRVTLRGLPGAPESAPPSLMKNEKLYTPHIADAVAWIFTSKMHPSSGTSLSWPSAFARPTSPQR